MFDLPKSFKTFLKVKGVSPVTIKNYLSDLNHFFGWMELFFRSRNLPFSGTEPHFLKAYFNSSLVERYKNYLLSNLPISTANRRLSTLRAFAQFCKAQNWISEDPTKEVVNFNRPATGVIALQKQKVLEEFRKALEVEKTASNTIKNYLCDIRGFLNFVETI